MEHLTAVSFLKKDTLKGVKSTSVWLYQGNVSMKLSWSHNPFGEIVKYIELKWSM